jgi:hypothetical protein
MTRTTKTFATAVFATALALSASSAFAQGGGYQWNKSGETTARGSVTETAETVNAASANALYLAQTGATREGVVATANRGQVIGVHPNAYYTAQNGDSNGSPDDSWQFADVY